MIEKFLFKFNSDILKLQIPNTLNNPFGIAVPEIARIATKEFQDYIELKFQNGTNDFLIQKGKMFGVLVVKMQNGNIGFVGAVSGKLSNQSSWDKLVPSIFHDSTDDFFINKGMTELTEIGKEIKQTKNAKVLEELKETRKQKSYVLQHKLFESYVFLNVDGEEKNVLAIFNDEEYGNPPAAAGECAAPKLLQFALKNGLQPIALAEFWWGNSPKGQMRHHKSFYPACKDKCRPILEFMLADNDLYNQVNQ